jgi:hypothetical protein
MTAKEFVKTHYPSAHAERHVEGRVIGIQKTYWLIRDGRQTMYMASGKSESNAWVNAKKWIVERVNKTNNMSQVGE